MLHFSKWLLLSYENSLINNLNNLTLKTAAKGKKVRRNDVWEGEDEDWSGDEDDVEENEYKQLGEEATRVEGTRRSSRISSLK